VEEFDQWLKPLDLWRPVPRFEGYDVSASGQVWSRRSGCLMTSQSARHGYQRVSLYIRKGKRVSRLVHQLVLEAFVGPCLPGMEARHYPCHDKANNALFNLMWCTRAVNIQDQLERGTHPQASKQRCPKCEGEYRLEPDGSRYCPPCHLAAGQAWRARQKDKRDAASVALTMLRDMRGELL
jgi:hypothetical protein